MALFSFGSGVRHSALPQKWITANKHTDRLYKQIALPFVKLISGATDISINYLILLYYMDLSHAVQIVIQLDSAGI